MFVKRIKNQVRDYMTTGPDTHRSSPAHVIRPLDFHHLNGTGVNKGPVTMGFKDWNALDSDLKNSDTIYQFRWRILHHVIVCCKRPI